MVIGRSPENLITPRLDKRGIPIEFSADTISNFHALIILNPDGSYPISDLNSLNGTYILRREMEKINVTQEPLELKDNDTIAFGKHYFTYSEKVPRRFTFW